MGWTAAIGAFLAAAGAWLWRAWRKALNRNEQLERQTKNAQFHARAVEKISAERLQAEAAHKVVVAAATVEREAASVEATRAEVAKGRLEAAGVDPDLLVAEANKRLRSRKK